jgi:putative ABC transport system ATP-binding protein
VTTNAGPGGEEGRPPRNAAAEEAGTAHRVGRVLASCAGVHHRFRDAGTQVTALDGVSLEVRAGELLVVMGPSGSGKSTLLSVLAGLLRPSEGEVVLCDTDLSKLDGESLARARRQHVGFVFQSFHLFGALTARANVECVLELKGVRRARARELAEAALREVGLAHRMDHRPARLSGGERQRVALARALASSPRVIFGDEPTSALDGRTAALILDKLQELARDGRAVVVVTHDLRLRSVATRVVMLEDGKLVS